MFIFFPLYARFGGGKGAAKVMFSKLFRPAAMSLRHLLLRCDDPHEHGGR